mgnify:FL=1
MRILIADDQQTVRSALRLALEEDERGWKVAEVEDAARLDDAVARVRPHVLLLDWELPGLDVAAWLHRAHGRWPVLRVVAMSSLPEAHAAALAAGADAFLSKGDPAGRALTLLATLVAGCAR